MKFLANCSTNSSNPYNVSLICFNFQRCSMHASRERSKSIGPVIISDNITFMVLNKFTFIRMNNTRSHNEIFRYVLQKCNYNKIKKSKKLIITVNFVFLFQISSSAYPYFHLIPFFFLLSFTLPLISPRSNIVPYGEKLEVQFQ